MTSVEFAAIAALTAWSAYKQTITTAVTRRHRHDRSVIFAVVAVGVGGFTLPSGVDGYAIALTGLVASVAAGTARGWLTRIWRDRDGRTWRRGTAVTVGLFAVPIVAELLLGRWAAGHGIDGGGSFAESLLMIAAMGAIQTEIVWRRSRAVEPVTAESALA